MSDEVVSYCGTGGWSGPKPGDPDNNLILTATSAYGGVDVNWTYPTLNGHAVIHTYLYRGITDDFNLSVRQAIVSGNFYYDRIPKAEIRQYYYWIQVVSVNGTVGDVIGPASAIPMGSILEVMQDLTGLIDDGVLAQSLKEKIDRISALGVGLDGEIINRIRDNESLSEALDYVLVKADTAVALIQDETTQRLSADEGLINSLNVLAVGLNSNAAAILEEKTVRVTKDGAIAQQINILYTESANNSSAISLEQTTRTDQNQAITTSVNSLVATTGQLGAAVQTNATAITDAQTSFSQQLNTAQSLFGNQLASVQTNLTTSINAVDNKASALYTAKVDVNGLIGGFGIYNNSQTVEAGFDVDKFWIGRTTNKVKPFIIEGGTVYINEAAINKVTINKLRSESGSLVFENNKLKADYIDVTSLNVGAFTGYAWPAAGLGGAHLSANGFAIGNANGGGKYFLITSGYGTGGNAVIDTNIPAYIEDAQITSLKVAGHNVTTTGYGEWSSGQVIGNGGGIHPQWVSPPVYLNFTVAPQSVVIIATLLTANTGEDSTNAYLHIGQDGVWKSVRGFSSSIWASESNVTTTVLYPSAGSHYFQLGLGNDYSGGWTPAHVSITILATLR